MSTNEATAAALKDELRVTKRALRLLVMVADDDLIMEARQELAEVDEVLRQLETA